MFFFFFAAARRARRRGNVMAIIVFSLELIIPGHTHLMYSNTVDFTLLNLTSRNTDLYNAVLVQVLAFSCFLSCMCGFCYSSSKSEKVDPETYLSNFNVMCTKETNWCVNYRNAESCVKKVQTTFC